MNAIHLKPIHYWILVSVLAAPVIWAIWLVMAMIVDGGAGGHLGGYGAGPKSGNAWWNPLAQMFLGAVAISADVYIGFIAYRRRRRKERESLGQR